MNNIEEDILKIKVKTSDVQLKHIQGVLIKIKAMKHKQNLNDNFKKFSTEVLEVLWLHMETEFKEFEDQLLCSTYFYTILSYSDDKDLYLKYIFVYLNYELDLNEKENKVSKNLSKTIALMYGIFQSPLLSEKSASLILEAILKRIFSLVTMLAYKYSPYTFIVFKIITLFNKVLGTNFENIIFNKDSNLKLLNVINCNWENPITGVRGLNKTIFKNLITVLDEETYRFILQELNNFYWNKAKYLMFSEIIEQYQSDIKILIHKYNFIEGLTYSLHKAGLVSAGADMYITVIKKINTDDEWCSVFLNMVMDIFRGSSIKPIENFMNYWCLNTLKFFPTLTKTFLKEINELDCAEHKLYSCMSSIHQSNRLGLLEKYIDCKEIEEMVLNGIEHTNAHIRALAFDMLCASHGNFLKSQNGYNIILDFLKNNVNSDCSILRIKMIDSLQKMLLQHNMKFLDSIQNSKDCDIQKNFQSFLCFYKGLQIFIIQSLSLNGNYQRNTATIQVTKMLLKSFTTNDKKKQKKTRHLSTTVIEFLRNNDSWILGKNDFLMTLISLLKIPSDDIRDDVMEILLQNYSDQLCESDLLRYLTEEALSCIRSRFFYQITCGQTIFKLIVNLLLMKTCTAGQFEKVEDVFEFAYDILKLECNSKMDIVKSIVEGKQLHAYLNILYTILEICLEKSYQLNIPIDVITSLLDILSNISNQFAWDQEASVSSDFSKMNDMVQDMIANSEHKICHQENETNISGLHQIVLNCLWLNVKTTCQLSSVLIKYFKDDTHRDVCEKCLKIICHVLETSRHKGAIEAGGTALGQAIQELTSSTEGSVISKIPMSLLKTKLNELISETSNMASVTRRGAGLSIMIHRIVSSDMTQGKPLFNYFMQVLLESCKKLPETGSIENNVDSSEEKDLPEAIYIHFLTKIVLDSSLATYMLYYSAKLAEIAFSNLTSPYWQIRNAALQLYGSLVPKLIGQKKNSGASEEVMATVAVDEFQTHSPKLWVYMVAQLKETQASCDTLNIHNNLVPILSILATMAPSYSFTIKQNIDVALLSSLTLLLGSPIYVVRRLTAKSLLNIYPFKIILKVLLNTPYKTENNLHGTLQLLNDFIMLYSGNKILKEKINDLKYRYHNIMSAENHSYLCRERFEHVFPECINLTENTIQETVSEVKQNGEKYSQGIFLWANFRIQKSLLNIPWDKIPETLLILAGCSEFEKHCEVLYKRLRNERYIPNEILLELSNTLYLLGFKRKSTVIWRTLYEISLQTDLLNKHLDTSLLYIYLAQFELSYRMRYMIPFAVRIFTNHDIEQLLILSKIVFKLCSPEIPDVDMRLIAAIANNEFASKFYYLPVESKINTIKAAIMFLQDEDEDIRNCSVQFYRVISKEDSATHPYICLRKILNGDFLNMVIEDSSIIQSMSDDLNRLLMSLTVFNEDEYNPFANESKNIYLEPKVLKQLLDDLNSD